MSYYSRRGYRDRRYWHYHHTSAYDSEFREGTPYKKAFEYLRKKFFLLSPHKFNKFSAFYGEKYGDSAKLYMQKTRGQWRCSKVRMSVQTARRILECIPPFLNKEEQFHILSFYIPSIIDQQKKEYMYKSITLPGLFEAYTLMINRILAQNYKLDWFVSSVFSEMEILEFTELLKYTMVDKLARSYAYVIEDFEIFKNYLQNIENIFEGAIAAEYWIDLLECNLEIESINDAYPKEIIIKTKVPAFVSQYNREYLNILVNHSLEQKKHELGKPGRTFIAIKDIKTIVKLIDSLKPEDEYSSKFIIGGNGGNIHLELDKKSLSKLKEKSIFSVVIFLVSTPSLFLVLYLLASNQLEGLAFIGFFAAIGIVSYLWDNIKTSLAEVNEYGKKRRGKLKTH